MDKKTISKVVEIDLCHGCGTCITLCPHNSIELTMNHNKGVFIPKIIETQCIKCGLCFKVCPGHEVNFKQLNKETFGYEPKNILIGNYLNCYIGHSNDYEIRHNSSSGGLITQILIFALEEGIIDGALITKMKKGNPLEPEPFIARTKDEIIEASKSKYCPVPANIAIKEILNSKKEEKFAIVGLSCHIHGIKKAEQINKELKNKIKLHIGIFCGHTPNFLGTYYWLNKMKIKKENIDTISYRGNGWPGSMYIKLKNEFKKEIPLPKYWGNSFGLYFFTPKRCFSCVDGFCELADISLGDAWLPEFSKDITGKSVAISRTKASDKLLEQMKSMNIIEFEKVNINKVISSQVEMIYLKKINLTIYPKLFKNKPEYNISALKTSFIDYLLFSFLLINFYVSSFSLLREIHQYIPLKVIKLYGLPYTLILFNRAKKYFSKN